MSASPSNLPAQDFWLPRRARIADVVRETANVVTYELEPLDGPHAWRFAAGQFNMLYLPGIGEAAISISSSPHATGRLAHTVRAAGNVTGALARRKTGDQLALRGPYGTAWPVEDLRGNDLLIVAGGIGLAPLRALVYEVLHARDDFGRVELIYGARAPRDLLYQQEFDAWRNGGIAITTTVDQAEPGWKGHIGVVTELMPASQATADAAAVVTCGPEIMMRFVARAALAMGTPGERIYLAMERNMDCAVGVCGHCQLGPWLVCRDGPIFCYDQVAPYLHVEDL